MRPALTDYRHLASGKVRELYRIDDDHLLFVATDRISAYDYILGLADPGQGPDPDRDERVLLRPRSARPTTWRARPTTSASPPRCWAVRWWCAQLEMLPVECVARGYLTGSGLLDYQAVGFGVRHRAARRAGRGQQVRRAAVHPGHQGRHR